MKIPFHDFGGNGPLLHFAHPNAYPPRCFQQLINYLLPHYHVIAIYHRPLWPGSQPEELTSWEIIGDDMLRFFAEQGVDHLIGVGHSMGAVATMFAAVKRPSLFTKLILIEPVVLPPAYLAEVQDDPELLDQLPIIAHAHLRRFQWPDRQSAFNHFRQRKAFHRWPDAALWDYVNYGLRETGDQVTLTYTREWEAHCYRLAAYPAWQIIPQITQPVLAIRASDTDSLWPESWHLWQQLQPRTTFIQIENAGHMVPMEQPSHIANLILN